MNRKKIVVFAVAGVIVILLAIIGVLAWKYQQASNDKDEAKKTSARIVSSVSELYLVPTSEEPTVALIQDKNKLGNQDFFKKAKNGDYLLVYQKEKIAIIYREEAGKLVNVGPVNIGDQQQDEGQTAGAQTESTDPSAE